ncbi:uncharacterized protein L969DRAFT_96719 [Mixia osmundae IAM 14324]|uniref:Holocytochrome c-type synthase n=1 Tax=Mixia osmundae (strain CBS 9802 / IAM 14324 / JCM 22182 / KY 12970) TaxID=764103 RepID=G7DZH4_MIXOS|nr:uncharacterized protein L969DRAFT_96719 [Mixia osmundae IAM 14324]KEI37154.1 hypothetical protein L969DRAFT_96719 [Mixia osmundae IAM 14324]GAA95984.1 hypothetical protein E5Q_02642 [Mixia osmundae IAM 14324]
MGSAQSREDSRPPPACPMHDAKPGVEPAAINPRNNIPELAQSQSAGQRQSLPTQRTFSSIPRAEAVQHAAEVSASSKQAGTCPVASTPATSSNTATAGMKTDTDRWVYPSPQQFFNALVRKGKPAPEEHVETMVEIHNWLNEQAWNEVLRWEERRQTGEQVQLAHFTGRPQDLSPKARIHLYLGKLFPETYSSTPPFDRHDWTIRRPGTGTEHRYVIDYYSAAPDEQGNPVFSLDVRPALDSPEAVYDRVSEWARLKRERYLGPNASVAAQPEPKLTSALSSKDDDLCVYVACPHALVTRT